MADEKKAEAKQENNVKKDVKSDLTKKLRENPWMVSTIVLGLVAVILLYMSFSGGITGNVVSENIASEKLVEYLNGLTGGGVSFASSEDIGSLYKINVNYQGKEIPVYITKDGNYFVSGISPITGNVANQEQTQASQPTNEPIEIDLKDAPIKGDTNAPVTILEFSDYECPFCGRHFSQTLPLIIENYVNTGKVRLVFKYAQGHGTGQAAHLISWCLNDQNLFWEFHDLAFANQEDVGNIVKMKELAQSLGADMNNLDECIDSRKYNYLLTEDSQMAISNGITGTPSFIINGQLIEGAVSFNEIKRVIDKSL